MEEDLPEWNTPETRIFPRELCSNGVEAARLGCETHLIGGIDLDAVVAPEDVVRSWNGKGNALQPDHVSDDAELGPVTDDGRTTFDVNGSFGDDLRVPGDRRLAVVSAAGIVIHGQGQIRGRADDLKRYSSPP